MVPSAAIIARLKAMAPSLGEVEGAVELSALMASKPQARSKPIAHVVPTGLRANGGESSSGTFTQMLDQVFAVFLTITTVNDPKGAKAQASLDALILEVILALAGWGPDAATGVLRLLRGAPVNITPGVIVYTIEFAISDQLRIA
jgi:hypothetical protein